MADGKQKPLEKAPGKIAREIEAAKALRHSLGADAEDAELLADMIEGETSLFELLDAILELIAEDQELLDGIKTREDNLAIRKARIKKRVDYRKAKIEQALAILGDKIERPEATLSLSKRAPKLIVTEEAEIPSQFWRTEPALDRKALTDALKKGPVAGAMLNNAPETLTIRRK